MKALTTALDILELFLHNKTDMSLADLSRLSGANKTTIYRIVSDLVSYGYLRQRKKGGNYSLGMKYLDFSGFIKSNIKIRDLAIPYLTALGQHVNETVIIAIRDGKKAIISETFIMSHINHILKVVPAEGTSINLHCTGLGKVILANMSGKELKEYLTEIRLESFTPNTITNPSDLRKHLAIIKRDGIAFDFEERHLGVRCVAAAIRGSDGKIVGSLGIIGPSVRLTRTEMKKYALEIKSYALKISRELGYRELSEILP